LFLGTGFYNAYIHPARKFPGPKLWAAFHVFKDTTCALGDIDNKLCELHAKYGPVVRISPDELSFMDERAWKDIYAHPNYLAKWPRFAFVNDKRDTPADIINSTHADHARIRRQLSHAFSEKALREQEELITNYINLLMDKLTDAAASGTKVDMVKWYNFTTFDIISDLAFGESFSSLSNGEYHPWVSSVFNNIRTFNVIRSFATYPGSKLIIGLLASAELRRSRKIHKDFSRTTVLKRLSQGTMEERRDFISYTLKHKDEVEQGMTEGEIIRTASTLIMAGSETTATLLSGVTYFLCTNPDSLKKVSCVFEPHTKITYERQF
jgi:cytochrome P450